MGNIVLKASEGVASAVTNLEEVKKSIVAILGVTLMKSVFKKVKKNIDYDEYGGAPLLGVKKCTIISHWKEQP